ncbi:MAG: type II toxin-antitoxin system RelB/DinJ family antitoxin [Oscillospiraceae bacterium]|jgi:DNA-damage-inducible protein J|nr:type II toxin-antitoxin system RelB/DinJ family antitoxin [Oscillospiraceae bacterium]
MAKTASLSIRIDPEAKSSADVIFSRFGITIADAVNIFIHKSIMVGGLPFDMTLPNFNEETIIALQEARDISNNEIQTKSYSSIYEMIDEINEESLVD